MLLPRSAAFEVILLFVVSWVRSESQYSEFYSSPAASAIRYIGENESPYAEASAEISKRIINRSAAINSKSNEEKNPNVKTQGESKPSYTPYEVPEENLSKHRYEKHYSDELDALDKEYSVPTTYKLDNVKKESHDENDDDKNEKTESIDARKSSETPKHRYDDSGPKYVDQKTQQAQRAPIPIERNNYNYDTSFKQRPKSNSAKAFAPSYGQFAKPTNVQTNHRPFQTAATSECEEVTKPGSKDSIAMNCVVCKDIKTGAKSEQCSYNSAPEPKAFFHSQSATYTEPHKEQNHRYKRDSGYDKSKREDYTDPYELAKAESQKYLSKPYEFGSDHYNTKDSYEEYKFPSDYFSGEASIKRESESQADKMMADGGTCKEVIKDGQKCKVCTNEKTGGNYEQCSYSSEPTEKKYAYVRERKFDGNGDAIVDKLVESSDPEKTVDENKPIAKTNKAGIKALDGELAGSEDASYDFQKKPTGPNDGYKSEGKMRGVDKVLEEFANTKNRKAEIKGLDPELYGSEDASYDSQKDNSGDYYRKAASQPYTVTENQNFDGYKADDNKKDVEKVLEDFAKKDRSTCQKAHKNGMTCFLCVNKDGAKHEECVYVSDGKPEASHIAYHQLEEFKNKGQPEQATAAASPPELHQKRKRPFKKAATSPSPAASEQVRTQSEAYSPSGKLRNPRKLRRSKNYSGAEVVAESRTDEVRVKMPEGYEPSIETPEEFTVGDTEGAYSSETKAIYSEALGVTLPRFVVEKSEFEENFDKSSSSYFR